MYLEISPRRTGKTTRLMSQLVHRMPWTHTILITPTYDMGRDLLRQYSIENDNRVNLVAAHQLCRLEELLRGWNLIPDNELHIFVDEFDMINSYQAIHIPISKNGYYATSLVTERKHEDYVEWVEGRREDLLLQLLQRDPKTTTYHHKPTIIARMNQEEYEAHHSR